MFRVEFEVWEHHHQVRHGLRIILCIICPHRGLLGVVDGSCLLLEIGGSGVDQGEAGGF